MRRRPVLGHAVPPLLAAAVLAAAALVADPPDSLRAAAVVALLVALGTFGLRIAGRLLSAPRVGPDGTDAIEGEDSPGSPPHLPGAATLLTAAGVFGTAGAVLPAMLLGIAGHLRPSPFLLVIAGVAAIAAVLPPAALLAGSAPRLRPREPSRVWPHRFARVELILLVAALASVALLVAAEGWRERWTPPRKLDDPSYHLSTVALWTHTHDLRTLKFDEGDRSTAFYPIGGELTAWALVAPVRDGDWATRWNQLLFGLLSIAAVVAVGRRLGLSARGALLAAVLWVSTRRAFPLLLFTAGNDHSTGFFFVALVDAMLLATARARAGPAIYAGTALGLLLGTKYLGVMFAPAALGLAIVLVAARWRAAPPGTWRRRLVQAAWAAAAAIAVGGYTYLRNFVALGNPVFPAPVHLFGLELPGWHAVTLEVRRHLPGFSIDPWAFLLRRDIFGGVFPVVTLPLAIAAPVVGALARGTLAERVARAGTFTLTPLMFLIFLRLVHDHRENRYLFAAIALASVAAAWILDRPGTESRGAVVTRLLGGVVGLMVLYRSIHWLDRTRLEGAALALVLLGIAWIGARVVTSGLPGFSRRLLRPSALGATTLGVLVLSAAAGGPALAEYRDRQFRNEPIAEWLDGQTRERGSVVAYIGHNTPYRFAGARLQNRIEIVPLNWNLEGRHFGWNRAADFPFDRGQYSKWTENLRRLGIEWIVVDRRGRVNPEHRWMVANPDQFRKLTEDGTVELWQRRLRGPGRGDPG